MNTWDALLKAMLWQQLDFAQGLSILDFGSGTGDTAAHLAQRNRVLALEPSAAMLEGRTVGKYTQLQGGMEQVQAMEDGTFDLVLCHNVLEYVDEKPDYLQELSRVVKPGGLLSLVKHNRPGRVMQMAVLLNDFPMANTLLDGGNGTTSQFGDIRYYSDEEARAWLPDMALERLWGARTFWDLQQNQACHTDEAWQRNMLALENRVSTLAEYQAIAFFHHLLFRKQG